MEEFNNLVKIVDTLRSKKGCSWDRAQKLENLKTYLLEEIYEFVDAVEEKRIEKIEEELGDLFLLLVFITHIFKEKRQFNIKSVLKKINRKLVTRHPHVFSSKKLWSQQKIISHWLRTKTKDKKRKTAFQRLPKTAPSLLLAHILFRESKYLDNKFDIKKVKEKIKRYLEKIGGNEDEKKLILGIILGLAKLAFHYNLDLESLLRKKIFEEAKKIKYKKLKD
jgi:uncharacterized protein YabN with tetrapyrrole methylase and pyrophosphatase domain